MTIYEALTSGRIDLATGDDKWISYQGEEWVVTQGISEEIYRGGDEDEAVAYLLGEKD